MFASGSAANAYSARVNSACERDYYRFYAFFNDVDENGRTETATDMVYITRRLLGLVPVPPSFRTQNPAIPPDDVIAARVDALGFRLDFDASGTVGPGTDAVYASREFLALVPVPPSFRTHDPSIPPDATITGNIQSTCGGT